MFDDDDVIRLLYGPYDGGEIDRDLFGGRLPNSIAVGGKRRSAYYDLDIDAAGLCYRFAGWATEEASSASRHTRRGEAD